MKLYFPLYLSCLALLVVPGDSLFCEKVWQRGGGGGVRSVNFICSGACDLDITFSLNFVNPNVNATAGGGGGLAANGGSMEPYCRFEYGIGGDGGNPHGCPTTWELLPQPEQQFCLNGLYPSFEWPTDWTQTGHIETNPNTTTYSYRVEAPEFEAQFQRNKHEVCGWCNMWTATPTSSYSPSASPTVAPTTAAPTTLAAGAAAQHREEGLRDCFVNEFGNWQCKADLAGDTLTFGDQTLGVHSGLIIGCPYEPNATNGGVDPDRCNCAIVYDTHVDSAYTMDDFCDSCDIQLWEPSSPQDGFLTFDLDWDCSKFGYYAGPNSSGPYTVALATYKATSVAAAAAAMITAPPTTPAGSFSSPYPVGLFFGMARTGPLGYPLDSQPFLTVLTLDVDGQIQTSIPQWGCHYYSGAGSDSYSNSTALIHMLNNNNNTTTLKFNTTTMPTQEEEEENSCAWLTGSHELVLQVGTEWKYSWEGDSYYGEATFSFTPAAAATAVVEEENFGMEETSVAKDEDSGAVTVTVTAATASKQGQHDIAKEDLFG